MSKNDEKDWIDTLKESIAAGTELCHGGCGDEPELLRLFGKHVGAWCRECWREVANGQLPRLGPPPGRRRTISRRELLG